MIRLVMELVRWGLTRKPLRTLFLLLTVVGALASFAFTEAAMRDLSNKTIETWRTAPYDMTVTGSKAYDLQERIAALTGVRKVERTVMFTVMIGVTEVPVAVPSLGSELLPMEFSAGLAPSNEQEIAITDEVASLQALQPGDQVQLALHSDLQKAVTYTISGIVQGGARVNVLTTAGAERVRGPLAGYNALLLLLDSSVPAEKVQTAIQRLPAILFVKGNNESQMYSGTASIAESMILITRALLLGAGVISLYMLFYLGQQERSYELGVLRALGFSRRRVITILVAEGACILLIGSMIGLLTLLVMASAFDLGRWQALLAQILRPGAILLGLGLLVIYWAARLVASRPITSLIKDQLGTR